MPSRAMIQTGRYLTAWENCGETIPREHSLLGECLREYGYQTCGIGKWHNGTDSYHRSFSQGSEIFLAECGIIGMYRLIRFMKTVVTIK